MHGKDACIIAADSYLRAHACVCLCVYERPVGSGFLVLKRGKTSAPGFPTLHRTTMLYVRMFQFVLKSRGHKTDTDTDTDTHTHTDTDTHTHTHTHTHTDTYTHSHIHRHTRTHTHRTTRSLALCL